MSDKPYPPTKFRVHAFFDAQNLFLTAKECFGHNYPNFDPIKLAILVTELEPNRILNEIHFYTGVHSKKENAFYHDYWMNKLQGLRRAGVDVNYRDLKYTRIRKESDSGKSEDYIKAREKGIDVKIAIDLIRLARNGIFDIAIVFSQDTDLSEAIDEMYAIKKEANRWMRFECAFPFIETMKNPRGLNKTTWRKITKEQYDSCIDPRDYRPKTDGLFS